MSVACLLPCSALAASLPSFFLFLLPNSPRSRGGKKVYLFTTNLSLGEEEDEFVAVVCCLLVGWMSAYLECIVSGSKGLHLTDPLLKPFSSYT